MSGKEENDENQPPSPIPTFSKSTFSSNGAVVITTTARMVLAKNRQRKRIPTSTAPSTLCYNESDQQLTKAELHSMRCVVEGLRLIHRDKPHIKEVLSHCLTEELYGPYEYVTKRDNESRLSCHFIVSGSVKVQYEVDKEPEKEEGSIEEQSMDNNEKTEIMYTHGAGEYLAMLSLENIEEDFAPPSQIYTLETTEFLRIDREEFHDRLRQMEFKLHQEIKLVLQHPGCILSDVPGEALDRILPHITRQHYHTQQAIIKQGEESNFMFCVAKGRCDITRTVHIKEAKRKVSFSVGCVKQYGCFGQECLLQAIPSLCTVTSTSPILVIKIHKLALQVVIKDHLFSIVEKNYHGYPSDDVLRQTGYHACIWNQFKYTQVKQHLVEVGARRLLLHRKVDGIKMKTMSQEQRYQENLRRFTLQGSGFEKVTTRIRSAFMRRPAKHDAFVYNSTYVNGHHRDRGVKSASYHRRSKHLPLKEYDLEQQSQDSLIDDEDGMVSLGSSDQVTETRSKEDQESQNGNEALIRKYQEGSESGQQFIWEPPMGSIMKEDNSNFMKSVVMVTLTNKDIVKKAKAEAEKKGLATPSRGDDVDDNNGIWHTSIHEEHDRLVRDISTDKQRTDNIRRYLNARAKERENDGEKTEYCTEENKDNPNKIAGNEAKNGNNFNVAEMSSNHSNNEEIVSKQRHNSGVQHVNRMNPKYPLEDKNYTTSSIQHATDSDHVNPRRVEDRSSCSDADVIETLHHAIRSNSSQQTQNRNIQTTVPVSVTNAFILDATLKNSSNHVKHITRNESGLALHSNRRMSDSDNKVIIPKSDYSKGGAFRRKSSIRLCSPLDPTNCSQHLGQRGIHMRPMSAPPLLPKSSNYQRHERIRIKAW